MAEIPKLQEQILANEMLNTSSGKTSELLDSFSGWLLSGFGVASALLISQYPTVAARIGPKMIQTVVTLFAWSLILAVIQKYLAVLVAAGTHGAIAARETAAKFPGGVPDMDFVLSKMVKGILPPARWFVARGFKKIKQDGDTTKGAIKFLWIAQYQGFLLVAQVVLVLIATFKIASAFHP